MFMFGSPSQYILSIMLILNGKEIHSIMDLYNNCKNKQKLCKDIIKAKYYISKLSPLIMTILREVSDKHNPNVTYNVMQDYPDDWTNRYLCVYLKNYNFITYKNRKTYLYFTNDVYSSIDNHKYCYTNSTEIPLNKIEKSIMTYALGYTIKIKRSIEKYNKEQKVYIISNYGKDL